MNKYKYLIVGGGMSADAAVKGIRKIDETGSIGIISNEENLPYDRPPLSKGLWKGDSIEKIWRNTPKENVEIHLSRSANSVDVKNKIVYDDKGGNYSFDKLLLATGGTVRKLPFSVDGIIYYRTLNDYRNLKSLTERFQSFAVIGGGFIGSEIAAALAMNGKSVTMIFPDDSIGYHIYPKRLSAYLNEFYESKGVRVLSKSSVVNISKSNLKYIIKTSDGEELKFDGVVAGIGIIPNIEIAKSAGLETNKGIVVNELLQTSHPDIFAAGDVAEFYNPHLNRKMRVEHEDNANKTGETAGINMAGGNSVYNHLPFFYSDLFELGYEAVGELNPEYKIIEDWKDEFKEGIIYYLKENEIRGVLLWNTWGQVDAARNLIAEKKHWDASSLKVLLPQ
jgi:3-phenylpropionate/trans-cinnamate dioxygenase ferredoxin reductase component